MHEACCQMLQDMLCYDQLNGPDLAVGEHCARQIQLTEERWKERLIPSTDQEGDSYLYLGRSTRGSLCIAPQLTEWLSEELRKEYAVAKERRKAREERALARPKKGAQDGKKE